MIDTAIEKRAQKRRAVAEKSKSDAGLVRGIENEPDLSVLNYKESFISALNYYNSAYSNKEKRDWTESFVGKSFPNVPDYEFRTIGTLIRLFERDQPLVESSRIDSEIVRLDNLNAFFAPADKVKAPTSNNKEKALEAARNVGAVFDSMLEGFRINGTVPDFAAYLAAEKVPAAIALMIPDFYTWNITNIKDVFAGNEEMIEAYSNIPRIRLRKYLNLLESIASICNAYGTEAKATAATIVKVIKTRKPRVKRIVPPSKVVASVKYMVEDPVLGKSINPVKLVDAKEVWIFNTKYRKLAIYRPTDGKSMSVKGTTIIGFDEALSTVKAIRKPEYVKDLASMGKRIFNAAFKAIKAKEGIPTGRINEDCLIVKVS